MNDAKDNLTKSKSARFSRPFAIDFIVPIQLEECIQRLEADTSPIRVKIRRIGEADRVVFNIKTDLSRDIFISGQGTFQRWQGTSTRVRGKLQSASPVNTLNDFTSYLKLGCGLVLFIFALVAIGDFSAYPLNLWALVCIGLFVVLPISTLTVSAWLSSYRQRRTFIHHLRLLLTPDKLTG